MPTGAKRNQHEKEKSLVMKNQWKKLFVCVWDFCGGSGCQCVCVREGVVKTVRECMLVWESGKECVRERELEMVCLWDRLCV